MESTLAIDEIPNQCIKTTKHTAQSHLYCRIIEWLEVEGPSDVSQHNAFILQEEAGALKR